MSRIQDEVDRNYDAFEAILPELLHLNRGKFALMKDGKVIGFFSTALDAKTAGDQIVTDLIYSIQLVDDGSISLGFYTDAIVVDKLHA